MDKVSLQLTQQILAYGVTVPNDCATKERNQCFEWGGKRTLAPSNALGAKEGY